MAQGLWPRGCGPGAVIRGAEGCGQGLWPRARGLGVWPRGSGPGINPQNFKAPDYVAIAAASGANYIILVLPHHSYYRDDYLVTANYVICGGGLLLSGAMIIMSECDLLKWLLANVSEFGPAALLRTLIMCGSLADTATAHPRHRSLIFLFLCLAKSKQTPQNNH